MGYEAELLSQINMNCKEFPSYAPLSDYTAGWWVSWCYPNGKVLDGYYDDVNKEN